MPHITTIPTAQQVSPKDLRRQLSGPIGGPSGRPSEDFVPVVVIDALRATSTIASALWAGVTAVLPVATVEQARARKAPGVRIAGERGGDRLPGFDMGNSPVEIRTAAGEEVVLTTTNGTLAVHYVVEGAGLAGPFPIVYAAAFVNRQATCRALLERGAGAYIVCAGQDGHAAAEDLLAAGSLVAALPEDWTRDDLAVLAEWAFREAVGDQRGEAATDALNRALRACPHGRTLAEKGYDADLAACADLDGLDVVPMLKRRGEDLVFVAARRSHGALPGDSRILPAKNP